MGVAVNKTIGAQEEDLGLDGEVLNVPAASRPVTVALEKLTVSSATREERRGVLGFLEKAGVAITDGFKVRAMDLKLSGSTGVRTLIAAGAMLPGAASAQFFFFNDGTPELSHMKRGTRSTQGSIESRTGKDFLVEANGPNDLGEFRFWGYADRVGIIGNFPDIADDVWHINLYEETGGQFSRWNQPSVSVNIGSNLPYEITNFTSPDGDRIGIFQIDLSQYSAFQDLNPGSYRIVPWNESGLEENAPVFTYSATVANGNNGWADGSDLSNWVNTRDHFGPNFGPQGGSLGEAVPEPAAIVTLGLGIAAMIRRKRQ